MSTGRASQSLYETTDPGLAQAQMWIGSRVSGSDGGGLGRLEDVWVDAESGNPAWLLLREGRFGGGRHKLVPFEGATTEGDHVLLPFEREVVRSSPGIGAQEVLTAALGERLRAHYAQGSA